MAAARSRSRTPVALALLLLLVAACGDGLPSAAADTGGTTSAATTSTSTAEATTTSAATTEVATTSDATTDTGMADTTSGTEPDLPPIASDGLLLTRMASWPGGGLELTVALEDAQGFAVTDDHSAELGVRWTDGQQSLAIAVRQTRPDETSGHLLIMIAPEPTAPEHDELLAGVAELIAQRPAAERIALYRWGQTIDQMVGFTRDREVLARVLEQVPMGTAQGSAFTPQAAFEEAAHQVGRVGNDQDRGLRWALLVGRELPGPAVDIGARAERSVFVQWVFRDLEPAALDLMGQGRVVDWLAPGGLSTALTEAQARVESFRDAFHELGLCGVPLEGREAELTLQGQDRGLVVELEGGAPEDRSPSLTASCSAQAVLDGPRPYPEVIDFELTPAEWAVYQQRLATGSEDDFALSVRVWDDGPAGVASAHLRGQASFWCERRNYTLDLATNAKRHWLPGAATDELYLLSMCLDDRYVRAYTVYQLYARLGVFPLKFRFVELRLNGQSRGVYLLLEKASEALVDHDARVRAVIRRGFYGGSTYPDVKYTTTTVPEAEAAYASLLSDLALPTGEALSAALDDRVDSRGYLALLAMNSLLQNGDYVDESWLSSTEHLHADGTIGDWYAFVGWDPDDAFSSCHYGGAYAYADPYALAYCAEAEIDELVLQDAVTYARYVDVLEALSSEITPAVFDDAADATAADLSYYLQQPGIAAAMTELVQANPAAVDPLVAQAEIQAAVSGLKASFQARRQWVMDGVAEYHVQNP
jgi:hypothetical protein